MVSVFPLRPLRARHIRRPSFRSFPLAGQVSLRLRTPSVKFAINRSNSCPNRVACPPTSHQAVNRFVSELHGRKTSPTSVCSFVCVLSVCQYYLANISCSLGVCSACNWHVSGRKLLLPKRWVLGGQDGGLSYVWIQRQLLGLLQKPVSALLIMATTRLEIDAARGGWWRPYGM